MTSIGEFWSTFGGGGPIHKSGVKGGGVSLRKAKPCNKPRLIGSGKGVAWPLGWGYLTMGSTTLRSSKEIRVSKPPQRESLLWKSKSPS